jgi:NAD+ synthase (glutamine-hydrolysing)
VPFNSLVGDVEGNARRMGELARDAAGSTGGLRGADLIVMPELAISGYPPKDLLMQDGFVEAAMATARSLGEGGPASATLVFGCPVRLDERQGAGIANSLLAYRGGRLIARYDKRLLPTYDVFDEDRYFVAGSRSVVLDVPVAGGALRRVGLSICEDLWRGDDVGFSQRYLGLPDPVAELCRVQPDGRAGAEIIVNPSASPFVLGKSRRHRDILVKHATRHKVHVAAVNVVGANDELVFDGQAAVIDPAGQTVAAAPGFVEGITLVDIDVGAPGSGRAATDVLLSSSDEELLFRALVLGVRDYVRKTGFTSALLGLSGGIDSAVTAVIAAAALGPARVMGVRLPSAISSRGSLDDAAELARRLGLECRTIPIQGPVDALAAALAPSFAGRSADVTEENLQSRVRGTLLMGLSNKLGSILLTTGNKSELAVGYCTLYGDMNGGLAVLSDVTKHWVYRLSRWMNASHARLGIAGLSGPPIPEPSITKPPSAELRPNQTDQDSLPEYDVLDDIIERFVVRRQAPDAIVRETGYDGAIVRKVLRLIEISEYKRKQAAIGLKVSGVAFGSGRRAPIAQGYRADRRI